MFSQKCLSNNFKKTIYDSLKGMAWVSVSREKNENLEEKIGPLKMKTHIFWIYFVHFNRWAESQLFANELILKYNKSFELDDGKAISKIN